jgi:hypothetical protein
MVVVASQPYSLRAQTNVANAICKWQDKHKRIAIRLLYDTTVKYYEIIKANSAIEAHQTFGRHDRTEIEERERQQRDKQRGNFLS